MYGECIVCRSNGMCRCAGKGTCWMLLYVVTVSLCCAGKWCNLAIALVNVFGYFGEYLSCCSHNNLYQKYIICCSHVLALEIYCMLQPFNALLKASVSVSLQYMVKVYIGKFVVCCSFVLALIMLCTAILHW